MEDANSPSLSLEEKKSIDAMKKDGASDASISKWIVQRRLMPLKKNVKQEYERSGQVPVINANSCGEMGGENGWSGWQASIGDYADDGTGIVNYSQTNISPTTYPNRFVLNTGAGIDACTPGPTTGSPAIPVVAPGFGNTSIQLGQLTTNGTNGGCKRGCAEKLTYTFTVSAADTNFIYAYAFVFDFRLDGNGKPDHTGTQVPYAEIYMLDGKDTVKCSHQKYMGDTLGQTIPTPGLYSTTPGCATGGAALYKPWTVVGVNLANYLGKTLTVHIVNVDCAQGGHYCHSYWDFMCPPLASSVTPFCQGQSTTMTGPASGLASNPYTYQWYKNAVPYNPKNHWIIIPGQTGMSYTTIPEVGDTFAVNVGQNSKCNFWIPFVPQVKKIIADFTLVNNCGTVTFTDATPTPSSGTITNWNWSFPGGTPSSVNAVTNQSQVVTYATAGTHTATLNIISSEGCVATKTLTVTTGNPVANFSTGPVCLGLSTTFSDGSSGVPGDPINTWNWNFGDGGTSTQQFPSHVYASAGTYSVDLNIKTAGGCTTTVTHTVTVNPIPVPLFKPNNVCFNSAATVFNNNSSGATQYLWDFGDGSSDTQKDPTHKYGSVGTFTVTLSATNAFGCTDKHISTAVIHPLPVPDFSSTPVCIGDSTCFIDKSSVAAPCTVVGWNWNFGDPISGITNTANVKNPCHVFSGLGPFSVLLTVLSDSGCTNNTTIPANTNPLPSAAIIPKNVCAGASTTFTDASISVGTGNAINSWIWDFGDGTPKETTQNPPHVYASAGTYTVILIVSTVNGCKDTTTNTIVIYNPPVPDFIKPAKGCSPVFANYTDSSTSIDGKVSKWLWSFPGGSPASSTVQNPSSIKYNAPGSYSVSLVVTSEFGCVDSVTLPMVDVYAWPTVEFCVTPSVAPTTNPVFNFCDMWSNDVVKWLWNFGDSSPLDSFNTDPVHSYSATANLNDFYTKQICVRVETQYGCWNNICHEVKLIPEFTFYIPNTFTPNGDNINEMFYGKCRGVKEYDIWLFDRWGNQVWDCHHDDRNINWDNDGTNPKQEGLASFCKWDGVIVQGGMDMGGNSRQLAQEDVYVWKVNLLDIFNKRHTYVGHVSIVR